MLKITNLQKSFRDNLNHQVEIFKNFNLEISKGEFVAIFGPNGCGKTTLLNLIAGVDKADGGEIIFDDRKTKIAFIFQNYRESLFPWLSVIDNISYPLKLQGVPIEKRREQAKSLCVRFGVTISLESYPYTLSGGQQQLVTILRALITQPDIILLDEPFSSLDYQTNLFMLNKIQEIWRETGITFVFVSHDIDEAIFLSQRLILLSNKPTIIVKEVNNVLPYPRTTHLMGMPEFSRLKHEALDVFIKQVNNKTL